VPARPYGDVDLRWSDSILSPRGVAALALALGALAAVAGQPHPSPRTQVDVDELARIVEHEEDHVTALQLAEWIRDRRPGLRVIDIRSDSEFAVGHIPGAERLLLTKLRSAHFRPDETVVLYSAVGTHAAQGWFFLRALGIRQVYFLRGGLDEWDDAVMRPQLATNATSADTAAFKAAMPLSQYFGGTRTLNATTEATDASAARRRRRRC
jgi:rhodanese-related sulfurtransferase